VARGQDGPSPHRCQQRGSHFIAAIRRKARKRWAFLRFCLAAFMPSGLGYLNLLTRPSRAELPSPAEAGALSRLTANMVSKKVTGNESVRRCVEGVQAAADGSDGTRTRDLRRDRAALVVVKALQTRELGAAAVTLPSPFCSPQPAAADRRRRGKPTGVSLAPGRHRRDCVAGVRQTHRYSGPPSAASQTRIIGP